MITYSYYTCAVTWRPKVNSYNFESNQLYSYNIMDNQLYSYVIIAVLLSKAGSRQSELFYLLNYSDLEGEAGS